MSQGMDTFLAEYYGTGSTAAAEATTIEKDAEIELFAKMAQAEGIDLNSLTDQQVETLYNQTFQKTAGEEEKEEKEEEEEKKKEEKKEAAAAELAQIQSGNGESEKVAEADFLGRVMAHAYVQELSKIAAAESTKEAFSATEAGMKARHYGSKALEAGKRGLTAAKDAFTGKELREGLNAKKNVNSDAGTKMLQGHAMRHIEKGHREEGIKQMRAGLNEHAKEKIHSGAKKTVGAYAGAATAVGGGAAAASGGDKKKKASAIDELAAPFAVEKAAAAGWDADEAGSRIAAIMVLGPADSEKVASATGVDQAVDIRAAELLEMAGYPVNWE